MNELNDYRKKINEIDKKMASLFEQRMIVSKDIANYKLNHALPILNKNRENEVIENNSKLIQDNQIKEYYVNFLKDTMELSKKYQERIMQGIKVAYSGVEGAFAHGACKKMFPNANYFAYGDFSKAYKAVENGECDVCVLPLENSYAGDVGLVMDLMFSGSLYVNQIYDLEVVHCLLGKKGSKKEDIKTVISHPQALSQCQEYISRNNLKTLEAQNTAIAAKLVCNGDDNSLGAIASEVNSELYNLDILETKINTSSNNTTRFGAFTKAQNLELLNNQMGVYTILVFTVKNEAGALAKTLNIIGSYGYNMRTLRSRPMKDLIWNYYFYVELDGSIRTEDGKDMLNALKVFCDKLKVVGTYFNN